MTAPGPRKCFVIMPFGDKRDADGKVIDFDAVYENVIRSALRSPEISDSGEGPMECVRCDGIGEAGWVHRKMIRHIRDDEAAIVDLSTLNANVFYELGVRHAARRGVTVLLRRRGTATPFNLQGFDAIEYDPDDPDSVVKARRLIAERVVNGLRGQVADSLVYEVLGETLADRAMPRRLAPESPHLFRLLAAPKKRIGILTGELQQVHEPIDVWVNSENTNMQMARYYDRSGSAVIRYYGAKRDEKGRVVEDTIAQELALVMGGEKSVDPGTILVTSAGELTRTHGVRRVFHAAAVMGSVGYGYQPVPNIESCVSNALDTADSASYAPELLRTILFPLMGTGTGGADQSEGVARLIDAAVAYFARRPKTVVTTAYFLALTDKQRELCLRALRRSETVELTKK